MLKCILFSLVLFVTSCAGKSVDNAVTAEISHGVDKGKIRAVVLSHVAEIKGCYENASSKNPKLAGKIIVQWSIISSGVVSEAHIKSSSINSPEVENCSLAKIKSWRFPGPPGNSTAVVSYPFVFQGE